MFTDWAVFDALQEFLNSIRFTFGVRTSDISCGLDSLDTSLFTTSIGDLRILTSPLLRGTPHARGSFSVFGNDVRQTVHTMDSVDRIFV